MAGRRGCCNERETSHGCNGGNDFCGDHGRSDNSDADGVKRDMYCGDGKTLEKIGLRS